MKRVISIIRETAATPAQEKTKLDNIENLYSSIQSLLIVLKMLMKKILKV
jgi:hypothetical protein